jgi:hypothetical protein
MFDGHGHNSREGTTSDSVVPGLSERMDLRLSTTIVGQRGHGVRLLPH